MKKKVLAVLLSITVMAAGVVGCGSSQGTSAPSEDVASSEEPAESTDVSDETGETKESEQASDASQGTEVSAMVPEGIGGYKIGFWYSPDSDLLSKEFREALNYVADLTNCEMVYYDVNDWSVETVTAAVESLVSQGCDGIIMIYGSSPAIFQYLNDSEVYYCGYTRSYTDEVAQVTDGSEYCCGWLNEGAEAGNVAYGYQIGVALANAGCKSIAVNSGPAGTEVHDDRVAGIEKAAAEYGMDIVSSYRGTETATGFSDILATYGNEIDGMAYTMGSDVGVAAIQAAGLSGKVKLAQCDNAGEATEKYLANGLLTATSTGNNVHIIQFYMQIFNALSGADRLFTEVNC